MLGSEARTRRRWASGSGAGLALLLVVGGCGSDAAAPATLNLASRGTAQTAALAADSAARIVPGVPTPTPGTTWPPTPSDAPVLAPSSAGVSTAQVESLARALGITDPIVEKSGGWITPASDVLVLRPRLIVLKDARGTWTYGTGTSCDLDAPVTDSGACTSSSIAVAATPEAASSGGGSATGSLAGTPVPPDASASDAASEPASEPATPPDATAAPPSATTVAPQPLRVTEASIAQVAGPVFAAAGVGTDADYRYLYPNSPCTSGSCTAAASATADPIVAGLPTWGLSTSLTMVPQPAADGGSPRLEILDANGFLGSWVLKDTYGVISATDGLARLAALPQPALAELCRVGADGQGCVETVRTITGARFGLMADTDGTSPVLAPAWLYSTLTTYTNAGPDLSSSSEPGNPGQPPVTAPEPPEATP